MKNDIPLFSVQCTAARAQTAKRLACCKECRRTKPPEIPNGGISGGCRLLKGRLRLFDMMRHAGRRIVSGMSPFDRACADFAQISRPASGRARFTARGGHRRQSYKIDCAHEIRRRCPSEPPSETAAPDAGLMLCTEITFSPAPSSDRAVTQSDAETVCTVVHHSVISNSDEAGRLSLCFWISCTIC